MIWKLTKKVIGDHVSASIGIVAVVAMISAAMLPVIGIAWLCDNVSKWFCLLVFAWAILISMTIEIIERPKHDERIKW